MIYRLRWNIALWFYWLFLKTAPRDQLKHDVLTALATLRQKYPARFTYTAQTRSRS